MKIMRHAIAVILLAACGAGCSGPSRAETGFNAVQPGKTTDAEVLNLMGSPSKKSVSNLAGLEMQVWEFEDSKARYTLTFGAASFAGVEPRVVSKNMEPKS